MNSPTSLTDRTASLATQVNDKVLELRLAVDHFRLEAAAVKVAEQKVADTEKAQGIAQAVAQEVQEQAHKQVADMVTRCLRTVFDDPYTFQISFERLRGRTEAVLSFLRNGLTVDPMDASGGGVVDVAGFALRLSCLLLSRPPLRRFVILDEPFKFVSEQHWPRLRALLHSLAEELHIQFLIITHIQELQTGKVVSLP